MIEFNTSVHHPAYDPPVEELNAVAAVGWKILHLVVTPPQNQYAVPGLLVIWWRPKDAG